MAGTGSKSPVTNPTSTGTNSSPIGSSRASNGKTSKSSQRFNSSDTNLPQTSPGPSAGLRPNQFYFSQAAGPITTPPVTKVPKPVSYGPNGEPIYGVNATLPDQYASGVLDLRWDMGNCSMSPGYDGYNAKSCSCVNRIGDWYHQYATGTITTQACQWSYDPGYATDVQSIGCSFNTVTQLAQSYTAPVDCCNKCVVRGKSVRLVYWPQPHGVVPSAKNNITAQISKRGNGELYGTVSDGYTFISPSVYVIYSDIAATASCVARVASSVPIGTVHQAVTRAYAPEALSSAKCLAADAGAGLAYCINPVGDLQASDCFQGEDTGWAQIDYEHLYNPPPSSVMLSEKQKCFTNSISPDFAAMLYASPQLSFPADVTDIDPLWATWGEKTCTPIYLGVADPPRALGQATALGPAPEQPVTAAADFGPQPTPAQPAGQVDPAPKPTAVANPDEGAGGRVPGFHAPASAMVGPDTGSGKSSPHEDPPANDHVNPAPTPVNQGSDDPAAAPPAAVKNGAPTTTNSPVDVDPSNLSPEQMDNLHQALSPEAQSKPELQPQPQPQPPPAVSGDSGKQVQNGNAGGDPAAVSSTSDTADGNEKPPPNPDPGSVPIVLTPVQPNTNEPVDSGQGQKQVQGAPPAVLPAGPQPVAHGQKQGQIQSPPVIDPPAGLQHTTQQQTDSKVPGQPASNDAVPAPVPASDENVPFVNTPPQIGSQTVQKQANGNVVIGENTIPEGQQATVDGHTVSNSPDHVVIDGATHALAPTPLPVAAPAPFLQNNQVVQVSNNGLQVAGQTLVPGSQVNLQGHIVNYEKPGQVIVDGTTKTLSPIATSNPIVIGSQTLSRAANGGVIVSGQTVAPGGSAIVNGHMYSIAGDSSVIANGQTYALPPTRNAYLVQTVPTGTASTSSPPKPVTLSNGLVITPQPVSPSCSSPCAPVYNLPNGASLSVGGSAAVVSGTTYSLLPSSNGGGLLVNGASTLPIPVPTFSLNNNKNVFTLAHHPFTASPTGFTLPNGATLTPGAPATTISGTRISLGESGTLVLGSSTIALPPQSVFTAGGKSFTAQPTGFVIAPGTTLTPGGPAATVNGEVVSLGKGGVLKIGGTTVTLGPATASAAVTPTEPGSSLGPAILSGLNGPGAAPTGSAAGNGTVATGGGARNLGRRFGWAWGSVILGGVMVFDL